jgi:hypothetical protein
MARENASAAGALRLHEPGQRVDHHVLGEAGPREDVHPVAIRGELFRAAIAARDQGAGDGRDATAAREDLIENDHPDAQSSAQGLRLRNVTEIVVGELMGQHTSKVLVAGLLEETGGDIELSPPALAALT